MKLFKPASKAPVFDNPPVDQPKIFEKLDRMPQEKRGGEVDRFARNFLRGASEAEMMKLAGREGMMQVFDTIMRKCVIKDHEGNEVNFNDMKKNRPYVLYTQGDKPIGWMLQNGAGIGGGRIYTTRDYDKLKNDPDRPGEIADVDFDFADEEDFGYEPEFVEREEEAEHEVEHEAMPTVVQPDEPEVEVEQPEEGDVPVVPNNTVDDTQLN